MDTLAKETLGLPIFICPTENKLITSATHNTNQHQHQHQHHHKSTPQPCLYPPSSVNSAAYNNNNIPTTPATHTIAASTADDFFATAMSTRPCTSTSTSFSAMVKRPSVDGSISCTNTSHTNTSYTNTSHTNPRRNTNTYTPPTYSPRRESLLSTKRLSQVYNLAAGALEVAWRKAEIMLGEEDEGHRAEVWREDLESGHVGGREGEDKKEKEHGGRYGRFGEEGGWNGWLD